jgi:transposase-like protein
MKEKGRKGQLGKASVFEESLKIAIARDYLTGQLSYSQVAKKYNLPGGDTARYFVSWYKLWAAKNEAESELLPPVQQSYEKDLEKQLKEANIRITALEMMIKNAEQELGIDIVKKSGTKQQDK